MRFESRTAKINTMKAQLEELQASSQKNAISLLASSSLVYHSLWINNRLYIQDATPEIVASIGALPEVSEVREEFIAHIVEPIKSDISVKAEWGIDKIEAEQAWALPGGNNGAGVVVGTIDTGARHTHEALRNNYRSEYGWLDPYNSNAQPMDGNGHGTHVMGTIAGSGGIGVAPGAQWIACRGCNTASCTETALSRCGQWTACPTLANGQSPDCSKAPQLSSNSWGGGQGQTWFDSIINSWHTANIVPVFANGNSGPSCGSANSPGDNARVIGVGSTTSADAISSFSSRGPARSGIVKPDVSAPGSDVRSSWSTSDTAYNTISGTSMATPHVSGTIALLLSQNRNLSYEQVKGLLEANTDRSLGAAATCGNTPPTQWPNNIYGWGRINARKSLAAAISG
jgi:subtilisin family serine protease